ncbi:hypothetical protein [Microlunatus sp. Gsoil 973]|uniref:hypothetical protein n=1 Tax=Microlunatus sp. Gsoil 973 TaxID=2672569 RepID=UPI0012B479CA|nr:hypothetical protein [Microlunatus sp. Gsoil 973]QGN33854.1 hypothetical protein GJV80_14695 [Microlunatus sp. Gsoil 973]
MRQAINVGRMQMLNKWQFIGVPLMVLLTALAFVILIGALLVPGSDPFYTGAGQAGLWCFVFGGVQSLTLAFPFSQGLSITRRAYFVGTTGAFGLLTLALAVLFYLLGLIENATDGWFVHGYVFGLPWVTGQSWYGTIALVWSIGFLLFISGFWLATLYKRWSINGALVAGVGVALVLLIIAAAITFTHNWAAFGHWAIQQTPLSVAGGILVAIAVLVAASFLTLRRALP